MIEEFTFYVPHRAAPQGSKTLDRGAKGKPFMREASAGVKPFRTAIRRRATGPDGKPLRSFTGPVLIGIVFEFRQAKSNQDPYPTGKNIGDLDKLTRAVLDGLTEAGVIEDDSFVVGWLGTDEPSKVWGPRDGVFITVCSAAVPGTAQSVVDFGPCVGCGEGNDGNHSVGECINGVPLPPMARNPFE